MQEIQFIQAWAVQAMTRMQANRDDERGASVVEFVIIAAIVAAAAIAIATALMVKFKNKADTISVD